jgi:cytoskeletal protein CcmA (bactofilin family)
VKAEPAPAPKAPADAKTAGAADAIPFLRPSLGSDTSVTGKLSFAAPTRIDGKLKGEVRANDLLLIGEQGSVEGTVNAKALILEGTVRGDVIGTEWVQVHASGRLVGSVAAHRIEIAHGAKVQARMSITPPPAPQGAPAPKRD